MNPLATLVIYSWIPIILYLFARFPVQRAIVISFVTATLFLPEPLTGAMMFPLIGSLDKSTATCIGALLAVCIYSSDRFSSFKPGWIDLPILVLCLCPIASQMSNGLSPVSPTIKQILAWGIPYLLGRICLNDLTGLRQLAIGIFIGGLLYIPLCFFEMRFSPMLHLKVYGYNAFNDLSQAVRYGGYRPTVFMHHGLWVGMWMMSATLIGLWLWHTGVIKKLCDMPIKWLALSLLVAFVLVKSTGAYIYLGFGLLILFIGKQFRTALPLLLLVGLISTYLYTAADGSLYENPQFAAWLNSTNNASADDSVNERSGSVIFRIKNEVILSEKARQKAILGWGDSGGNRIYDEYGKDISVTDSIWIITFGTLGTVGLASLVITVILPPVALVVFRYPPSSWSKPKVAPAVGLAVILVLYMIDSSLNSMNSAVFPLMNGGIAALVLQEPEKSRKSKQFILVNAWILTSENSQSRKWLSKFAKK